MRNTNKCCCLTSRTGATIIGLLGISLGSFAVIVFATGFGVKSSVFRAIQDKEDETVLKVQEGEITEATSDYVIKFYENVQVFYPHILTIESIRLHIFAFTFVKKNNEMVCINEDITSVRNICYFTVSNNKYNYGNILFLPGR